MLSAVPPNGALRAGDKPAVISISSHVARGTVGNRAVVFALESLGHPVWSVPTVTLPWHPGHGPSTRLVPDEAGFERFVSDLCEAPWLGEVGAVITGYFGAPSQVAHAARLVDAVKRRNPAALFLCDPVVGDGAAGGEGAARLYQPEATLHAIRDELVGRADIATPNRFELELLTGLEFSDNRHLVEAASALGPARVVVTSAFPLLRGGIGNLLVDGETTLLAEHRRIERVPHGLGDLTGAVFLARLLAGATAEKALQATTAAVFEILARTTKRGADELTLETDADVLRSPLAMVQMRRLAPAGGGLRA